MVRDARLLRVPSTAEVLARSRSKSIESLQRLDLEFEDTNSHMASALDRDTLGMLL